MLVAVPGNRLDDGLVLRELALASGKGFNTLGRNNGSLLTSEVLYGFVLEELALAFEKGLNTLGKNTLVVEVY